MEQKFSIEMAEASKQAHDNLQGQRKFNLSLPRPHSTIKRIEQRKQNTTRCVIMNVK